MALSIQKFILLAAAVYGTAATAQEPIQILEPGTGYSRLKKWAIDSKLVFENYSKDTIVIRDNRTPGAGQHVHKESARNTIGSILGRHTLSWC